MVELIIREQDALIMCLNKNVLCLQKTNINTCSNKLCSHINY